MKEANEINEKNQMSCNCSDPERKTSIEDELRYIKTRLRDVEGRSDYFENRLRKEEQASKVLIDCLANEHQQLLSAQHDTEFIHKRLVDYREAIDEIIEKCREVLKLDGDGDDSSISAEQLAKEILEITHRF